MWTLPSIKMTLFKLGEYLVLKLPLFGYYPKSLPISNKAPQVWKGLEHNVTMNTAQWQSKKCHGCSPESFYSGRTEMLQQLCLLMCTYFPRDLRQWREVLTHFLTAEKYSDSLIRALIHYSFKGATSKQFLTALTALISLGNRKEAQH